jgi:hypothetical protein
MQFSGTSRERPCAPSLGPQVFLWLCWPALTLTCCSCVPPRMCSPSDSEWEPDPVVFLWLCCPAFTCCSCVPPRVCSPSDFGSDPEWDASRLEFQTFDSPCCWDGRSDLIHGRPKNAARREWVPLEIRKPAELAKRLRQVGGIVFCPEHCKPVAQARWPASGMARIEWGGKADCYRQRICIAERATLA